MPKTSVTAEEVSQAILNRIMTGQYHPGSRLPSVRDLAEELGSNRNTVNKAYQMLLKLGVIEGGSSGRQGFRVHNLLPEQAKSKHELISYFHQQSVDLVWKGMAAGVSAHEMFDQLSSAIDEVYGPSSVQLLFIECNEQDSGEMGDNLHHSLGVKVDCGLLSEFHEGFAARTAPYDLIVTTFHHMSEVLELVKQSGGSPTRVVGIDTRPTPETMLGIARLPKTHIGLVSTMPNTSHMLKYFIYSYHPEWQIEATTIHEKEAMLSIAASCDHLVMTHTCVEYVEALTGRKPDVVVYFQIDEQSLLFIQQRIQQIQREKSLAHQSLATPTP
jgi:DNA-binding transcriptional regulator YhcF (GntR family)